MDYVSLISHNLTICPLCIGVEDEEAAAEGGTEEVRTSPGVGENVV